MKNRFDLSEDSRYFDKLEAAVAVAREIAASKQREVIVHDRRNNSPRFWRVTPCRPDSGKAPQVATIRYDGKIA